MIRRFGLFGIALGSVLLAWTPTTSAADPNEVERLRKELVAKDKELKQALDELALRRQEVTALTKALQEKESALVKYVGKLEEELMKLNEVARKYKLDFTMLQEEHRHALKKLEQIRALLEAPKSDAEPIENDLEGEVREVTKEGFISISIGSDKGLLKGHTLEVFRLEPRSQYLGTIVIIDAGPKEAVGKVQNSQPGRVIQPKDKVATRIVLDDKQKLVKDLDSVKNAPYVHAVIFYLKKDAPAGEVDALIEDTHKLLGKISTVRGLWVGEPAVKATPEYAIKDYHVGLLVLFDDFDGLKKYLDDPLHQQYLDKHGKHWDKVPVYDFLHQKPK